MRRNKKKGVYTNRTIKTCPCCCYYCTICKGVCKMDVAAEIDPESVAPNHPLNFSKKKPQHFGVGSFKRGRIFVPITKHRENSWEYNDMHPNRFSRKKKITAQIKEELELHNIIKLADKR